MAKDSKFVLTQEEFEAMRSGNQTIFRKVFDQYFGLVQFVVRKCGVEEGNREDVVQDVFIKFYESLNSIEGPHKIKSWLCIVARNRAIDKLRAVSKSDPSLLESLVDENQAYASYRREIEVKLVGDLLDAFASEPGGLDFKAFYKDGRSVKAIAEANGEAVSTVTTRLTRMRRKFGELIRQRIVELRQNTPFQ